MLLDISEAGMLCLILWVCLVLLYAMIEGGLRLLDSRMTRREAARRWAMMKWC